MRVKLMFKWFLFSLAAIFVLFSLLPYFIPLQQMMGARYELAYENSEFNEVEGVEIHFRQWKESEQDRVNILLVHGLGGSTFSWRHTFPALSTEGYRVIAVDLPGFGLSERREGLEHSAAARAGQLLFLLEELYPGEKWHLVGHSMGGAVVTAMAIQEPHIFKSITLVAGALSGSEPSPFNFLLQYPPASRWIRVLGPRLLFNETRFEQILASAYGREPSAEETEGYYLPLTIENTDIVLVDLIKRVPESLLSRLDALVLPVILIWGENDAWVPLEQGKILAELIPGSELVIIEGEGHCPMETSPERFNAILTDFLERAEMP